MAYPEEGVWTKHHGKKTSPLIRAGRFELGPNDVVEWEVRKHQGKYFATNNYFTFAEAWDNAWIGGFSTAHEAVNFARNHAAEAIQAMTSSMNKHGNADPYEVAAVVNRNRYEAPPPWTLGSRDEPIRAHNLIGHVSDWDGTLRSYKAMTAIERFHPRGAGQIAQIFFEEKIPHAQMDDVEFPMFSENQALEDFVIDNMDRLGYERAGNYFISHWSLTDAVHDLWMLSPDLQRAYPTTNRWFSGVNIGEGWQDLLRDVQTIIRRAE
jgi:hypothetical protein